ncbi:unnamed protein product [Rotaria sordida]|uniref:FHA domain-containing protein n=1 Tax=Rotaria sordida TaxID=392033 RepID=A0A814AW34_9BILA|nr:unnamed protein product [Rotaria sordida]
MKGYLYSEDGSCAFPLGPKVTTIGRENCDISINSPQVDNQHALIEYDDEQRCFILKDLNSSTGTYVHECRVQNAAVRLADRDFIRFGFNGLPLEFRIEQQQQETTMPSIYPRQPTSNSLHLITQTIPSRRLPSNTTNHQQQIDVQQNTGFSLRNRALSAGTKKISGITPTNQTNNGIRDSIVRPNAWTITASTSNAGRTLINGSFTGELDISDQDNSEINNRVGQLEKEVKGREGEIRELTDRLRSLEPLSSTFKTDVHTLRAELDKVKREKQTASGLISSLQRDLHSKESSLVKLNREIDGLKTDSRDKDLKLQSLQSKVGYKLNVLRDRSRAEEDRHNKEKEAKIKLAEQQINELNENINRLKSQLQDTEKQLLRVNQNEQKLKQECEHTRGQLAEIQRSEATLKSDLANAQRKHNQLCVNIWRCFSNDDDNDEYDEDQHDIIEQIQQLQQQLNQSRNEFEHQRQTYLSSNEQIRISFGKFVDIFTNAMQEQTTEHILLHARQQMIEIEETDDDSLVGIFKKAAINAINCHVKLISGLNSLIIKQDDQEQDLYTNEILALIRRQYEELEREKENLSLEQISREQTFRSELEQITTEKDTTWQQRFNEECDRLREQTAQLQREYDEQSRLFSDRLEKAESENSEYLQRWNILQTESTQKIDELTTKLQEYQQQLTEENERQNQLTNINETQKEEFIQLEKEKDTTIEELNRQIEVYKDQVRQFSITIVQLEKNFGEEQEKRIRLQAQFDNLNKNDQGRPSTSSPPVIETVIPVLATPIADLSQELFAYKSRVQEQEQIIVSLRRDLAGMTARLSDVQGELSEKQKYALEKSESTIREQTKELNETRLKLSKLSDIVDKQSTQIETLESNLSKSKILANQYQLLVDQRQADIDRLTKSLQEKNLIVEQVEKINHDEGRITHELISIGAQCKGERHEQTIGRQREALNELRARIKSLEQLRPVNPSYEKVLQQVVLLKRELAELRARQALPNDIPYLTITTATTSGPNSIHQQSQRQSTATTTRQSSSTTSHSEQTPEAQKIIEERTAHAETMNSLQSCDELQNTFTRQLMNLLDIDDDNLLNVTPLTTLPSTDRYVALQQRQRTNEILIQKIEMLRERLTRKEELLRDYEKDLGKLRQAEILLREKNILLQDLETDKRTKDDEALFLRNTLKETQDNLNQEKRFNSSIKLGRNTDQSQSNELIRRSGGSTATLHHHCPPDGTSKVRTVKRDMNEKLNRKNYEIKTLKQELHEALDTLSEQSHKVKLLELQSKTTMNNADTNILTSHNS